VFTALRNALPEWINIGASAWVVDTIGDGVLIDWESPPTPYRSHQYPLDATDAAFMTAEIDRGLAEGYFLEITDPAELDELVCMSSAFVVHSGHKPRVVFEYKHPNSFQAVSSCKYETLQDLAQVLRPGDALLQWDVKDAYHHLKLRLDDRRYLAFRTLGRIFVPVSMPFGLRVAPLTWTKVIRPVVQHLRGLGCRMIAYVDDFGGAPPAEPGEPATAAQAAAAYTMIESLFQRLGLRLHPTKGVRHGPTAIPLLGHVVDTVQAEFRLPEDRVDKLVVMAVALSRSASANRRWVNFPALRRFCGTAVSTTLSVPAARYRLRSFFTAMQCRHPRSGDARLGHQALRDLLWWVALQRWAATGRAIWPGAASMLLDTDASNLGWGAVLNQAAEARGFHAADRNGLHINCLELGAITLALRSFQALIPAGTVIRLRTDSMVALGVLEAGSSRSPVLMSQYRELYELCAVLQVELRVEHIPSVLNEWADRLSRENDSTDWTLGVAAFRRLEARYGPHSVDLFATELTTRCPRFFSRRHCPGALGVNALRHPWVNENAWANPPFHLVGAVVYHTVATGATVTLVAPVWPAQPWWRTAVEACWEWQILPTAVGVYAPGSRSDAEPRAFWRTAVFRFAPTPRCATTLSDGTSSSPASLTRSWPTCPIPPRPSPCSRTATGPTRSSPT